MLNTLRRRFLATLILIGVIPFILTGLVLLYLQNLTLHEQSTRELATLANGIAGKLETFVHEMENDARALAALPTLVAMQPVEQQIVLQALFQQYDRYAQLGVADPATGQLLVLAPPKKLLSVAHVPSFQAAAQGQQKSLIFPALSGDQLILHIHTPIWDANHKVVGVLGSPVPLPNLAAILQAGCPPGGNAYLLDQSGKIVVQAKEQALPSDLDYAQALGFSAGQLPVAPNAITYHLQQEARLANYAPVTSFGWLVVVDVPESLVWAPTLRSLRFAGLGLLLSLGLSILAAVRLSKNLTDPVRNLAYAAQALEQGDASAQLPQPANGSVEIHTLVAAFQNMRQAVTQREGSLRQSERRNRALVAAIPDILLRMKSDGTILDLHVPTTAALSWFQAELIGCKFQVATDSFQPRWAVDRLQAALERTRQSGKGESLEVTLSTGGASLNLEARFSAGGDDEILLILRDISAQKQLAAVERKYSSAMEALNDGLAILDADLNFTFINNAYVTMHGYAQVDELQLQPLYRVYPTAEYPKIANSVLSNVRQQGSWRGEAAGLRKDGSTFIQELSGTYLETGEFVWIVRDVTEQKQAGRALQQAQKLESLGVLAGGVAHDFNNLLAVIMGNAALAQLRIETDSPVRKYVDLICDSAQHAADLTRQLLAYAGKGQFLVESIRLTNLIQENYALLSTAIPRGAELIVDLPVGLPAIMADRGQIQQVLMNLVINAAEALHGEGGRVIIRAYQRNLSPSEETTQHWIGNRSPGPGEYLCLEVEDTGSGIASADIEKIFDPFFTTKSYGRGLGLSAMLGIIHGQKGGVQVTSQVGQGSIFRVFFAAATPATAVMNRTGLPPLSQRTGVVLVIDDEENVRQITGEMLKMLGFQVLSAQNGWEGIEIFTTRWEEINLILLDMKMPIMDGIETYRRLMTIAEVPVIFASGYSETETFTQADLAQRRVAYLQKPYLPTTLAAKMSEVLPQ